MMSIDTSVEDYARPVSAARSVGSEGYGANILPGNAPVAGSRGIRGRVIVYTSLLAASTITAVGLMVAITS
jgi:hypothetical protein